MGYYNVSPNYKLSTFTISKSLLESTRFNQWISMQSGSTTCYSAFISVSQPQSLSLLLLLQPQWQACTYADCVCASPVPRAADVCVYVLIRRHLDDIRSRPVECMTCFNQCPGRHIQARALHPVPAHQVMPFWFLRAPSTFSPVTTWECAESLLIPPLCSIH